MGEDQVIIVEGHWIGGEWGKCSGSIIDVENPSTGERIATIPAGTASDTLRAIEVAKQAFPAWKKTSPEERAGYLDKIADYLEENAKEVAGLISRDMGMPFKLARLIQVGSPTANFRLAAKFVREFSFVRPIGSSKVIMEPVGVVGAITPWNYPLHQIACKVAYALAAGCSVVLKPSEVAPLCVLPLIKAIEASGLPKGLVNVVWGYGPDVGQPLSESQDVNMLSFTGSTQTGIRLAAVCATTLKRTSMELGGKSASLVLPGADFEKAVKASVSNCYLNSGQTCSAWTRLLVPRADLARAEEIAKKVAEGMTPGDPFDAETRIGPLVSRSQKSKVLNYIKTGIEEGARLIAGGDEPDGLDQGYFVRATVFSDVTRDMTIAKEEIFGPVLAIMPYDSVEEAIEIANDTQYGLAGGVWAENEQEAEKVARDIDSGQIDLNGARFNLMAPFGGFKMSGHGRENGPAGIEEFLEQKSIQY